MAEVSPPMSPGHLDDQNQRIEVSPDIFLYLVILTLFGFGRRDCHFQMLFRRIPGFEHREQPLFLTLP